MTASQAYPNAWAELVRTSAGTAVLLTPRKPSLPAA